MDILDFALQMELDGKAYYVRGAAESNDPQIKKILTTLAEEEAGHYKVFRALKEGQYATAREALNNKSGTPALAKNVFRQLAASGQKRPYSDSARALWKEAMTVEEKSERLYREAAQKETDQTRRDLLNRIADEEKNHIYLIDNMLSFMQDPAGFVQSANFRDFMSWEGH